MKNEFYISKSRRTIIKISEIIHCGLVHHSYFEKENITKEDLFDDNSINYPDCIFFNMNNGRSITLYCKDSKEAKAEFNKILKFIQENDI